MIYKGASRGDRVTVQAQLGGRARWGVVQWRTIVADVSDIGLSYLGKWWR